MRIATVDQVAAIAGRVPPRYRALVLVAAFGGLRWGELVGLRPANQPGRLNRRPGHAPAERPADLLPSAVEGNCNHGYTTAKMHQKSGAGGSCLRRP
jgi:integrase